MAKDQQAPPSKKKPAGKTGKDAPDGSNNPGTPGQPAGGMGMRRGMGGLVILVLAVVAVLFFIIDSQSVRYQKVQLSLFHAQIEAGNVEKVLISGSELRGKFKTSVPIGQARRGDRLQGDGPAGHRQRLPVHKGTPRTQRPGRRR